MMDRKVISSLPEQSSFKSGGGSQLAVSHGSNSSYSSLESSLSRNGGSGAPRQLRGSMVTSGGVSGSSSRHHRGSRQNGSSAAIHRSQSSRDSSFDQAGDEYLNRSAGSSESSGGFVVVARDTSVQNGRHVQADSWSNGIFSPNGELPNGDSSIAHNADELEEFRAPILASNHTRFRSNGVDAHTRQLSPTLTRSPRSPMDESNVRTSVARMPVAAAMVGDSKSFVLLPDEREEMHGKRPACPKQECVRAQSKLKDAMHANRTWEKHSKGLQDRLVECEHELEDLKERYQLQAADGSSDELRVAKQTINKKNFEIESLKTQLTRQQVGANEELLEQLRVMKLASLERESKMAKLEEECQKQRRLNRKLENALVQQQEQLLLARNQADSAQQNFIVATREKDLYQAHLLRIADNTRTRTN